MLKFLIYKYVSHVSKNEIVHYRVYLSRNINLFHYVYFKIFPRVRAVTVASVYDGMDVISMSFDSDVCVRVYSFVICC